MIRRVRTRPHPPGDDDRKAGSAFPVIAAKAALLAGGFAIVALIVSAQIYASAEAQGRRAEFGRIAIFQLAVWGAWAVLTPLVAGVTRRWPIRGDGIFRCLAIHALLGAGLLAAKVLLDISVTTGLRPPQAPPPGPPPPPPAGPPSLLGMIVIGLGPNLAVYVAIVGVCHAIDYYRKYRQRELDASKLEAQLAGARLQVLEMQLRPHFLFNTLNAISTLVRSDPDAAERMIASLGDLLRAVLHRSGAQEVALADEMGLIDRYLDIARMRYRDRLTIEMDVAESAGQVLVPTLILQPLVENAIEHGVARRAGPGRIRIRAALDASMLRLSVADDGPGLPPGGLATEGGIGLINTRERLRALYGDAARIEIASPVDGGTSVTLEIPVRCPHDGDDSDREDPCRGSAR